MSADPPAQSTSERARSAGAFAWLPVGICLLLLAAAAYLGWQLRAHAPTVSYVDEIVVAAAETPVVLGWRKLGQHPGPRSASGEHLLVERRDGQWLIGNRSQERRVLVRTDRLASRFLHRWQLAAGDRITLADAELTVVAADGAQLVLADPETGRRVSWRDGRLTPAAEPAHGVCRSAWRRLIQRVRWRFREVNAAARPELPLFTIGGGVNCSNRWQHVKLPPRGLSVSWHDGAFWLAPGARRYDVLMQRAGGGPARAFTDLTIPVDGVAGRVERIILGRTNYRLVPSPDSLTLVPVANIDLWFENPPEDAPVRSAAWAGAGTGPAVWLESQAIVLLPGAGAALVLVAGLVAFWSRRRQIGMGWLVRATAAAVPAALGGWTTLLLLRGGGAPDAMLVVGMVWLAWGWCSLILWWSGRLAGLGGWIWAAAVFLAGTGVINMLQLGAGAENTRWLSFVLKHAALLGLFGWALALLSVVTDEGWRRVWTWLFNAEGLAAALASLLVLLMAAQLALGSEEGIAGIQPVEAAKSVFVLLLAFLGMNLAEIRSRETSAYRRSPVLFLLPFLRFIGVFLFVVLSVVAGVRDFSPIIILGLVTLAWLWKAGGGQRGERTAAGLWSLMRPGVATMLVVLAGAGLWAHNNAEALPAGMPQKDRILVWAEPELHPHSGSQVLGAMDRVGEGGWTGALDWFGPNGRIMTLPAVQDDFIAAFFLHRFGGLAGLVLLTVQILYLAALFAVARRFESRSAQADFRLQHAGKVVGFTLFGLAWMQIAHWTIAWCNTLGLLPVMGQPMSWLSAGNSHLLGFTLLTLVMALITVWAARPSR